MSFDDYPFNEPCFDLYEGWIIAWVDGLWRHCRVATGWVAIAQQQRPNQHIGVFLKDRLPEAWRGEADQPGHSGASPSVGRPGSLREHPAVEHRRCPFRRLGVDRQSPRLCMTVTWIFIAFIHTLMAAHYTPPTDQMQSVAHLREHVCIEQLGRFALPEMPKRWKRTALGLANS